MQRELSLNGAEWSIGVEVSHCEDRCLVHDGCSVNLMKKGRKREGGREGGKKERNVTDNVHNTV